MSFLLLFELFFVILHQLTHYFSRTMQYFQTVVGTTRTENPLHPFQLKEKNLLFIILPVALARLGEKQRADG